MRTPYSHRAVGIASTLAFVLLPALAHAAPEGIRLAVDAPGCLEPDALERQVEALGGELRAARDDERARTFSIAIVGEGARYTARFTVRDLVGRETERRLTSHTCADATKAVALLVALALDADTAEVEAPAAEVPLEAAWPMAKEPTAPAKPAREGPRGSGGLAISVFRGWRNGRGIDETPITGVHVSAAWRFGYTRLGASIAVEHDTGLLLSEIYVREVHGSGPSGRLGGIIGWGAPWNDTFIGFLGEAGVAAGVATGASAPYGSPDADPGGCCKYSGKTITTRYASPYGGAWLMLQVPWKLPVRPTAGLGAMWVPNIADSLPVAFLGEVGVIWKAW